MLSHGHVLISNLIGKQAPNRAVVLRCTSDKHTYTTTAVYNHFAIFKMVINFEIMKKVQQSLTTQNYYTYVHALIPPQHKQCQVGSQKVMFLSIWPILYTSIKILKYFLGCPCGLFPPPHSSLPAMFPVTRKVVKELTKAPCSLHKVCLKCLIWASFILSNNPF